MYQPTWEPCKLTALSGRWAPRPRWQRRPAASGGSRGGRPPRLWGRGAKFTGGPPRSSGRSRGLPGRPGTPFGSATPFCRLLTTQSENTAPLSPFERGQRHGAFSLSFFCLPPPPSPLPPLSPSRVLRQLRTMLGASQQQRQMAELLDVHHTIPFLPLAF